MRAALASAAGAELAANALFCLGACILLAAAVGAVALTARAGMHPADAGLLLSACYAFPSALKDLVINLGWLEMSAVSCARLAEYAGMQGEDEAQGKVLGRRKGGGGGTPASPAGLVVTDLWVARGGAFRAVEGSSSSSSSEEQQLQVPLLQEGPLPEWVFQGLTLSIPPGAKVAVLGPSGSGKSTLFKVLLRLWTHSQGSLVLGGVALGALATAAQVRRLVAVLPQGGLLFTGSVAENLLGSSCPPAQEARTLAVCQGVSAQLQARILASGGLGGQLHPAQWSTGEAVLLSLARLVLQQGSAAPASLLLLDELSSEVDAQLVQQLMAVLLARPETVLAIEHREAGVRAGGGFTHVLLVGPGAGPQGAVLQSMDEYRAQLLVRAGR
jgi:ABC-type multidrug transport system fused ATPase/permease subunit